MFGENVHKFLYFTLGRLIKLLIYKLFDNNNSIFKNR